MTLKKNLYENIVGKKENAGKQHVLLFQQFFFLPTSKRISAFTKLHLFCHLAVSAFYSDPLKNLLFSKELKS